MGYDSDDFPYEKEDALSEEREEVENTLAEERQEVENTSADDERQEADNILAEEQIWSMLEKGKERDRALISPGKSRSGRILKPTVRAQEALHTKHANLAKAALESSREVSLTDLINKSPPRKRQRRGTKPSQ